MGEERKTRMTTVLGESSVVLGNVTGGGDLEVRGKVQGSIEINGRLLISEGGLVLGGVEAVHIEVAGHVRGDLTASDGVSIHASGQVEGNISAPRVGINAGARVLGNLRTGEPLPLAESAAATPPLARQAAPGTSEGVSKTDTEEPRAPRGPVPDDRPKAGQDDPRPAKKKRLRRRKSAKVVDASTHQAATASEPPQQPAAPRPESEANGTVDDKSEVSNAPPSPPREKPRRLRKTAGKGPPKPPTFVKGTKGHHRP